MKIRVMNISDYKQVYQLWLSCSGIGLNNLDDSKEGIERFLNRNPETCFVAEIEQTIIGVIIAGNDGRRGYIYHTAVNPNYRHQGIANKLVNEVMGKLKALGINKAALLYVSKTFCHQFICSSVGFSMPISSHHQVGIPCSNAHSWGVSRLTMYSISGVLSLTTGGSL